MKNPNIQKVKKKIKSRFSLKKSKCRKCGEWFAVDVSYCPNCGIIKPVSQKGHIFSMPSSIIISSVVGLAAGTGLSILLWGLSAILPASSIASILILIGSLVGLGFGSAIWGSLDSENTGAGVKVFIVAALGLFGGGMGMLLGKESAGLINIPVLGGLSGFALGSIGGSIIEKSFWGRKSKKCLNSQKKIYQDRINELGGKLDEISEAISILTKDPDKSERQEKRIKTLQMKADAVEELKQRYLINIKKMDLIRWGWGLQRLTTLLDNIDYEQCKERLTLLKELKSDGKELESTWLGDSLMSSLPDGEYNVKMLEDGLNSCDSWLDELKDKLAELAAGTISKLTPIETVKGSKSAWDEFNNFIQISRSSVLFSAQDELDNEYQRLKLDEDSSKELEGL